MLYGLGAYHKQCMIIMPGGPVPFADLPDPWSSTWLSTRHVTDNLAAPPTDASLRIDDMEAGRDTHPGRKLRSYLTICNPPPIVKYMVNYGEALDRVFQALADTTRRDIVERLVRGPASVGELARPFTMSLSAVMQHLQVLEACGLVRSEKVGRTRTCHIEPDALRTAEDWIGRQRTAWEHRLDQLGDYLTEHPEPPEQRSTP